MILKMLKNVYFQDDIIVFSEPALVIKMSICSIYVILGTMKKRHATYLHVMVIMPKRPMDHESVSKASFSTPQLDKDNMM